MPDLCRLSLGAAQLCQAGVETGASASEESSPGKWEGDWRERCQGGDGLPLSEGAPPGAQSVLCPVALVVWPKRAPHSGPAQLLGLCRAGRAQASVLEVSGPSRVALPPVCLGVGVWKECDALEAPLREGHPLVVALLASGPGAAPQTAKGAPKVHGGQALMPLGAEPS